jgi:hypothetical protein
MVVHEKFIVKRVTQLDLKVHHSIHEIPFLLLVCSYLNPFHTFMPYLSEDPF